MSEENIIIRRDIISTKIDFLMDVLHSNDLSLITQVSDDIMLNKPKYPPLIMPITKNIYSIKEFGIFYRCYQQKEWLGLLLPFQDSTTIFHPDAHNVKYKNNVEILPNKAFFPFNGVQFNILQKSIWRPLYLDRLPICLIDWLYDKKKPNKYNFNILIKIETYLRAIIISNSNKYGDRYYIGEIYVYLPTIKIKDLSEVVMHPYHFCSYDSKLYSFNPIYGQYGFFKPINDMKLSDCPSFLQNHKRIRNVKIADIEMAKIKYFHAWLLYHISQIVNL